MSDTETQIDDGDGIAVETVVTPQSGDDTANAVEKRAREMGWVPEDEWHGAPEKWRPADKFVEFGDSNIGLLRKEVKSLTERLGKRDEDIRRLVSSFDARARKEYERGIAEAQAKVEAAVEAGDMRAYRAAQKELEQVKDEVRDTAREAAQPQSAPIFDAWVADNDWYQSKRPARVYADSIGAAVMMEMGWDGKSTPTRRMYDAVTAAVKDDHPEWFERPTNPRRSVGSGTEGRSAALSRGGAKGWDDIPAEERGVAMSLIGKGQVFATQADYAKAYFKKG